MRKQYHLRPSPAGLQAWDIDRLIALTRGLRPQPVPLTEIRELDEPFWSSGYERPLSCRDIALHARLIEQADAGSPIILSSDGRVMDGMHRVVKALLLGIDRVSAVRFAEDPPPDFVGVHPDDLPYNYDSRPADTSLDAAPSTLEHPGLNLRSIEAKAFVPARDHELSKRFYVAIGFALVWATPELALLRHDGSAFLLQNFFDAQCAAGFMMHLQVASADDWWRHLQQQRIAEEFGVVVEPPADRPWGMRDFPLYDPSGVLWRIGQPLAPTR